MIFVESGDSVIQAELIGDPEEQPYWAAEGTFALKAGAWFRRVRLLIISPDPRPPWPPSGRK
jgi:hypothetical protein